MSSPLQLRNWAGYQVTSLISSICRLNLNNMLVLLKSEPVYLERNIWWVDLKKFNKPCLTRYFNS